MAVCCLFVLLLHSLQYGAAFELTKKHRINMNLMYDHRPAAFHANTETFIRQLDLPTNINLFLTNLRFDDNYYIHFYITIWS